MRHFDTIIIGAGAAGMFCARFAGQGGRVLVLDHGPRAGEKIRISGGGRCNFTNMSVGAENYISENKHFAKSALARFTPDDFLDLLRKHQINWHEKTLGQLFCDGKATQIVDMLRAEMIAAGAELRLNTSVDKVEQREGGFRLSLAGGPLHCRNLVIATGGKSIPKMGASGFAYQLAHQFGLRVSETRPALVPLTFPERRFAPLAGVALPVRLSNARASFDESMLFTHRGLSGPAILQISSYWREGEAIQIDLLPDIALAERLRQQRAKAGRRKLSRALAAFLPARLVAFLATELGPDLRLDGNLGDQSDQHLAQLEARLHNWTLTPNGSEGYRTAEVTLGGIATDEINARTMECAKVAGLYFTGEALDVTGWLGGYNFHWAWASAAAAGRAIAKAT